MAVFSDLHIDFEYTPGNSVDCGKVLCCRSDSGQALTADDAAGQWGDYMCDIPTQTVENMFDFIRNEIKPDAAMWAGDSISHNLDTITFEKKQKWNDQSN